MARKRLKNDVQTDQTLAQGTASRYWVWVVLCLILVFAAGVRLRLLSFPLERDEGEYAYMGQLMLDGVPPYQAASNMKFPGTYAAYAVIMGLFGQTAAGIHFGVMLVNLAAITLVFFITRHLLDEHAGLMAAATYVLLTMNHMSLGMAGHATHFVVLAMLGALLIMLRAGRSPSLWKYLIAGVLLSVAVLMKQPAAAFVVFGACYVFWTGLYPGPRQWAVAGLRLAALALGVAIPLGVTALLLWHAGVFEKFWMWTIIYAGAYGSQIPLRYAPQVFMAEFTKLIAIAWPLWALAGAGVLMLLSRTCRRRLPFLLVFAAFSFLAVASGFYFRNHYFIMLAPAVAMVAGGGLTALRQAMERQRLIAPAIVCWVVFAGISGQAIHVPGRLRRGLSHRLRHASICGVAHHRQIHPGPQRTQ